MPDDDSSGPSYLDDKCLICGKTVEHHIAYVASPIPRPETTEARFAMADWRGLYCPKE